MIATGQACSTWSINANFYTELVGKGYISELPIDPINNASHHYRYEPSATADPYSGSAGGPEGYILFTTLENGGIWGVCTGPLINYASWCR